MTTAGHDFLPRKYPHDRTGSSSCCISHSYPFNPLPECHAYHGDTTRTTTRMVMFDICMHIYLDSWLFMFVFNVYVCFERMFECVTTAGHDFLPCKYPHDRTGSSNCCISLLSRQHYARTSCISLLHNTSDY